MTPVHTSTDMHLLIVARQRLPLLPRSRPVCRSLTERIDRVHRQASAACQPTTASLRTAAEAHNLAALIFSDCGMAEAARDLCWRQFDLLNTIGPTDQATAKLVLQPLINLGRLHTRDGDGTLAYELHHTMFQAMRARTTATIGGRSIDLGSIVQPGDDHRAIVQWLWTILLADGLRALCRAGRWSEALHHATQHHGIGERPLDGRQIAIIAHSAAHHHAQALRLIETTTTSTDWEKAVTACLQVLCLTWAGEDTTAATDTMLSTYLAINHEPEHGVFHLRLGLTVYDLITGIRDTAPVTRIVERIALRTADAYSAREILTNQPPIPLSAASAANFEATMHAANLGMVMPPEQLTQLHRAVQISEAAISDYLFPSRRRHDSFH